MNNLDNYKLRIDDFVERYGRIMLRDSNIVAIGRGRKIINGNMTDTPSLTYLVKRKYPKDIMSSLVLIPSYINEVITDVIECGGEDKYSLNGNYTFDKVKENAENEVGKIAVGGGRIINSSGVSATMTCAVTDREMHNNIYYLTNGSFLVDKLGKPGKREAYYEPVGGSKYYLGALSTFVHLREGDLPNVSDYNEVDAAIGLVGPDDEKTRTLIMPGLIDKTGIKNYIGNIEAGQSVYKIGCGTGKTIGTVILSPGIKKDGNYWFKEQISVVINAKQEDIGALGVRESDNLAFGILMSRNARYAHFSNIGKTLDLLGLDIL